MNTDSLIQVFQNLPHDSTRLVALNNIIRIEQNNPKCILFSGHFNERSIVSEG